MSVYSIPVRTLSFEELSGVILVFGVSVVGVAVGDGEGMASMVDLVLNGVVSVTQSVKIYQVLNSPAL